MGKARIERCRKARERYAATWSHTNILRLPAEVRNLITEQYVNDIRQVHISTKGTVSVPSLAQACSQLRHEILPVWREHFESVPMQLKCFVRNFDFEGLTLAFKELPEHIQTTVTEQELLHINIRVDEDYKYDENLRRWMGDCASGVVCKRAVYSFTQPLVKLSTFEAIETTIAKSLRREVCMGAVRRQLVWDRIARAYDDVLTEMHKAQPDGLKMYWEREIGQIIKQHGDIQRRKSFWFAARNRQDKIALDQRIKTAQAGMHDQGWVMKATMRLTRKNRINIEIRRQRMSSGDGIV
ncbi:hypothetical protein LTR56_011639 [Elasticomyces elasticus]|nr:hypothetical protein LTR56_011639 [Elasticomyces elasticus]KAK3647954.1 hypothetical protein LTR22_013567 [Elasticomyces elasticus]KAK4905325.1 hypothetical protein LTR49_025348 [Elasticomyces elasticus]KAK5765327.1 hypothetical protein LTS12_004584 [Elasticomyces elasticus]